MIEIFLVDKTINHWPKKFRKPKYYNRISENKHWRKKFKSEKNIVHCIQKTRYDYCRRLVRNYASKRNYAKQWNVIFKRLKETESNNLVFYIQILSFKNNGGIKTSLDKKSWDYFLLANPHYKKCYRKFFTQNEPHHLIIVTLCLISSKVISSLVCKTNKSW